MSLDRSQRHHDARPQALGPREQHPQQRHEKIRLDEALVDLVQHHVTEILQVRPWWSWSWYHLSLKKYYTVELLRKTIFLYYVLMGNYLEGLGTVIIMSNHLQKLKNVYSKIFIWSLIMFNHA